MGYVMKKDAGFTLIEIIVTLVILGMMGAIAGMLIAQGAQGYVTAKANNALSHKTQLALDRMILEFEDISAISAITESDSSSICYTLRYYDGAADNTIDVNRCIGRVGSQIKIVDGATPPTAGTGSVLIDNVNVFRLDLYSFADSFTGSGTWTPADLISSLASIRADLILNRTDGSGGTLTFSTLFDVRRNGKIGWGDMPLNWNK
ncbi:MAG: type II secretion system protein [Deltaproteobacteria bacterium]|nr:type II secretion system protein [Deltaproteobacteria bacterium]